MSDSKSQSPQTATQNDSSADKLLTDVEENTPFRLNLAYISLKLPGSVFKKEVGGDAN
jgi:hypothetical protein